MWRSIGHCLLPHQQTTWNNHYDWPIKNREQKLDHIYNTLLLQVFWFCCAFHQPEQIVYKCRAKLSQISMFRHFFWRCFYPIFVMSQLVPSHIPNLYFSRTKTSPNPWIRFWSSMYRFLSCPLLCRAELPCKSRVRNLSPVGFVWSLRPLFLVLHLEEFRGKLEFSTCFQAYRVCETLLILDALSWVVKLAKS